MAISKTRQHVYEDDDEEVRCFECAETLEFEEAFTCNNCSTEFCKIHIKNHKC